MAWLQDSKLTEAFLKLGDKTPSSTLSLFGARNPSSDGISFLSASESDYNSFAFDSDSSQREGNDMGEIGLRGFVLVAWFRCSSVIWSWNLP